MYVTNRNAVVVSRASQRQNTPHVSRPHSIPANSVIAMNSTPTSALAPARRSHPSECFFGKRYSAEATAVTAKAR